MLKEFHIYEFPEDKIKIIKLLGEGNKTAKILGRILFTQRDVVRGHLDFLKYAGIVRTNGFINTKGKPQVWTLTKYGNELMGKYNGISIMEVEYDRS